MAESESIQRETGSRPSRAAGDGRLDGSRVLLVDDEADNLELLTLVFKKSGAEVATASSSRDALQVLQRADIDVLISDIQMPNEDGYELIRKVRTLIFEQRKPLIAVCLTAHARAEDRARALQAGYQAHIAKPVEPANLIELIATLIQKEEGRQKAEDRRQTEGDRRQERETPS